MKKKILFLFLSIVVLSVGLGAYFLGKDRYYQFKYDKTHTNPTITSALQLESVFKTLKHVSFQDIPIKVRESTHSTKAIYKSKLAGRSYLELTRDDLFKKVVRDYRLKDFLSKDLLYAATINTNQAYYTTLDKNILLKFLELIDALEAKGYNTAAIELKSAHRHPKRNYYIGGASQSRHIFGEAIDISIGDISKDGKANSLDKKIVLDILDEKIIGNSGGLGLYPGTDRVHFDTRGYRARWNSYRPAIRKK